MRSGIDLWWRLLRRLLRDWEGVWCACCGGYVNHSPYDAHRALLDQPRLLAAVEVAASNADTSPTRAAGLTELRPTG